MITKALILHFIADFLLQTREMGAKKSSEISWLAGHILIQFLVFLPAFGWRFSLANAGIHMLIDATTWNLYKLFVKKRVLDNPWHDLLDENKPEIPWKNRWMYYKDHWFYTTIGFDQLLHGLTLVYLCNKFGG